MIGDILKKIFGDKSTKDQKRYQPFVDKTNTFLSEVQQLTDDGLREKSIGFRAKIKQAISVQEAEVANLQEQVANPALSIDEKEAIFEQIRKIAKDKPVVAVMDTVAASGGYITAIAADYIVARGNTITGSIGVIFSMPEFSKLLATVGITMEELKSGDLKAEPSPY